MMQRVRAATLALAACAALVLSPQRSALVAAKIDPNDKGDPLFPDGHPNITYLTDDNWDTWMEKTDKPWLVDFYHPLYVFVRPCIASLACAHAPVDVSCVYRL